MSKVLSGRVPDELADAFAAEAGRQGVKRGALLEAAVRAFLRVPEREVVSEAPAASARGEWVDPAADVRRWNLERQARLNAAKYRSS